MSTTTTTNLTAADVESLDVEELLRGIFASDVDLKELLHKGLDQIEHTEKIIKKSAKAEAREAKKAARQERAAENAEVNNYRIKAGVSVAIGAACVGAAFFTPGLNLGLYGLGATQALRAGRSTKQALDAAKVRDALRAGAVLEVSDEAELRAVLGDARFEAVLGIVDAGMMVQLGIATKDPFFMVLAAMDALIAGWACAIWADRHNQLRPYAEQQVKAPKPAKKVAANKGGAHRRTNATVVTV